MSLMNGRVALVVLLMVGCWPGVGLSQTNRVFTLDPSNSGSLPPGVQWANQGPKGETCLRIEVPPENKSGAALLTVPINLVPLRDCEILLSYDVGAQEVTKPEHDYNGIKAQLHYESASAGPQWFNEGQLIGSFGWKHSSLLIRVDPDATEGVLQLGMQECAGTAWLANVTIDVVRRKPERPQAHRGVVSAATYSPQDLADLAGWKVNLIRWQLINPAWDRYSVPSDPAQYEQWLMPRLDELAQVLDQAQKVGIKVVVDLHFPPGGRDKDGTLKMVMDKALGEYFMKIWVGIAQRFKGHPAIWAYDLMNEPVQKRPSPPGVRDWFDLQAETAKRVRAIDPTTFILIAADNWDAPDAFAWMRPVWVPSVIYTVHMYWPYEYTHQGTDGRAWSKPEEQPAYPGTFNTLPFDRAALARHLAPVKDFQLTYGARIFVGEFSVVRWAPGAAQFLTDEISLFEDYKWDWAYHAFREETAWSLEDEDLPYKTVNKAAAPTDRLQVLLSWWARNGQP